jgi:hypothetical protein
MDVQGCCNGQLEHNRSLNHWICRTNNYHLEFLLDVAYCNVEISIQESNYPGIILVSPAAASEGKGKEARAPRAPARAYRPPDGVCVPRHPLLSSYTR